jgi:hypothetical protein
MSDNIFASDSQQVLDATLGVLFIGFMLSTVLYGLSTFRECLSSLMSHHTAVDVFFYRDAYLFYQVPKRQYPHESFCQWNLILLSTCHILTLF